MRCRSAGTPPACSTTPARRPSGIGGAADLLERAVHSRRSAQNGRLRRRAARRPRRAVRRRLAPARRRSGARGRGAGQERRRPDRPQPPDRARLRRRRRGRARWPAAPPASASATPAKRKRRRRAAARAASAPTSASRCPRRAAGWRSTPIAVPRDAPHLDSGLRAARLPAARPNISRRNAEAARLVDARKRPTRTKR